MSEIYREQPYAILHQDDNSPTSFKVMADVDDSGVQWNETIIRWWVNLAFYRLGLPFEVDSVVETGSINPDLWRWFAVSAIEKAAI